MWEDEIVIEVSHILCEMEIEANQDIKVLYEQTL